jgi:hypothetical protein
VQQDVTIRTGLTFVTGMTAIFRLICDVKELVNSGIGRGISFEMFCWKDCRIGRRNLYMIFVPRSVLKYQNDKDFRCFLRA